MSQSPEEVQEQFDSAYPGGLGKLAHRLWNEICLLHTSLATYLSLYSSKENVETLNSAAPRFFAWFQGQLRRDLFSHIARLTDPKQVAGRENATMEALEADLRACGHGGIVKSCV